MSVKFEKETIRTNNVSGGLKSAVKEGLKDKIGLHGGKEDTMHKIGEAVTGGHGQTGYLAVRIPFSSHALPPPNTPSLNGPTTNPVSPLSQAYLKQLQSNPLRTKMLTSGSLSGLQEVIASWLAHDRSKHGHYFSSRVPKMVAYGALVSAPLGHMLVGLLQKIFAKRTSLKAKILQILVSNLIVRLPEFPPLLSKSHKAFPLT